MKRAAYVILASVLIGTSAWAIPSQITYQGTLKEKGLPISGVRTMVFRITNSDGTAVYWSSGNTSVQVNQGLFSTILSPTNVDWQNVTPYVEVSVEGQTLSPREPLTATVYATLSQTVVDGAITQSKINSKTFEAPGPGLVPPGAIMMFSGDCPGGWTRYAAMDGRFPMGGAEAGLTGGSASHAHSLTVTSTFAGTGTGNIVATQSGDKSNNLYAFPPGSSSNLVNSRSADTNSQSNIPPYETVIYCQKS